jgi:hypothetical protein
MSERRNYIIDQFLKLSNFTERKEIFRRLAEWLWRVTQVQLGSRILDLNSHRFILRGFDPHTSYSLCFCLSTLFVSLAFYPGLFASAIRQVSLVVRFKVVAKCRLR